MPLFEIKLHLSLLLTRQRNFEICIADQNRDFFQPSSSLPICHFYVLNFEFERRGQCDQIWRFFGLWATF